MVERRSRYQPAGQTARRRRVRDLLAPAREYPEILAWERLWNEALNDTYRDMYAKAHEIAPAKGIGWHIWHNNSFSPFYRAEQDYGEFQKYSDFLKVVIYNLCGGERLAQYVRSGNGRSSPISRRNRCSTSPTAAAVPRQAARPARGRRGSAPTTSCARRSARVAGAGPKMKIWPGIDVDIPTGATSKKTHAGRRLSRREGRVRGRRARCVAVAEVFGDAPRQHWRRRTGAAGAQTRLTTCRFALAIA